MVAALFSVTGVGLLLLTSEILWRKKIVKGEYGRKLVHILMGMFIAIWPFYMQFMYIRLIALCAIAALLVSRQFKIFLAVHDVKRRTYGEVLYPLSVFIIALIARADWIFATAILFVALADGMAAVFGKKWGKKFSYTVGKANKTVVGTIAYVVFAYVALLAGYLLGGKQTMQSSYFVVFVWLPMFTAFLEAVSPFGLDNISVPLVVACMLNVLLLP